MVEILSRESSKEIALQVIKNCSLKGEIPKGVTRVLSSFSLAKDLGFSEKLDSDLVRDNIKVIIIRKYENSCGGFNLKKKNQNYGENLEGKTLKSFLLGSYLKKNELNKAYREKKIRDYKTKVACFKEKKKVFSEEVSKKYILRKIKNHLLNYGQHSFWFYKKGISSSRLRILLKTRWIAGKRKKLAFYNDDKKDIRNTSKSFVKLLKGVKEDSKDKTLISEVSLAASRKGRLINKRILAYKEVNDSSLYKRSRLDRTKRRRKKINKY